jgi:hypothetical protein
MLWETQVMRYARQCWIIDIVNKTDMTSQIYGLLWSVGSRRLLCCGELLLYQKPSSRSHSMWLLASCFRRGFYDMLTEGSSKSSAWSSFKRRFYDMASGWSSKWLAWAAFKRGIYAACYYASAHSNTAGVILVIVVSRVQPVQGQKLKDCFRPRFQYRALIFVLIRVLIVLLTAIGFYKPVLYPGSPVSINALLSRSDACSKATVIDPNCDLQKTEKKSMDVSIGCVRTKSF